MLYGNKYMFNLKLYKIYFHRCISTKYKKTVIKLYLY